MRLFVKTTLVIISAFLFFSCGKKELQQTNQSTENKGSFAWKENISIADIPDTPVKAYLNGKELKLEYINYEIWRGSNDNVLNFSDKSPENKCGFIEKDNAFTLTYLSGQFKEGEFLKESFNKTMETHLADYRYTVGDDEKKVNVNWNCALVISEISDEYVKGKIAMCFKDDSKSWIAGTFTAIRCMN